MEQHWYIKRPLFGENRYIYGFMKEPQYVNNIGYAKQFKSEEEAIIEINKWNLVECEIIGPFENV